MDRGFILVTDSLIKLLHSYHSLVCTIFYHWCSAATGKRQQSSHFFLFPECFNRLHSPISWVYPSLHSIRPLSIHFKDGERVFSSFMEMVLKCREANFLVTEGAESHHNVSYVLWCLFSTPVMAVKYAGCMFQANPSLLSSRTWA